tara:strand:- start:4648 stop:4872 length:225 start_codon:yes stop_codon:yes gene_type:complete
MKNLFGLLSSKRAFITTFMIVAWVVFGLKGINNGTNMSEFAAYFAALSPFVIGYIYGETKRPSGCCKENGNCKK